MKNFNIIFVFILLSNCFGQKTGFFAGETYDTWGYPNGIVASDFNNDGYNDLAITEWLTGKVYILLNSGDGKFGNSTSFAAGGGPTQLAFGDFNEDGNIDLAVPGSDDGHYVSILFGTGDGTFSSPTHITLSARWVVISDFNNDNHQDIIATNYWGKKISILLGNGDGSFIAPVEFATIGSASSMYCADFNEDNNLDIALSLYNSGSNSPNGVQTLIGDGSGSFTQDFYVNFNVNMDEVNVSDLNHDSHHDIVAVGTCDTLFILLGDGLGGFLISESIITEGTAIAISDFNNDNNRDIAIANGGLSRISILLGDGTGVFSEDTYCITGSAPTHIACSDFNNDGWMDLSVTNRLSGNSSVYINSCITNVDPNPTFLPNEIKLYQNFPNPFNSITNVEFYLPLASLVEINIVNIKGQIVLSPVNKIYNSGKHKIEINTLNLSSGVYLFYLKVGNVEKIQKFTLVK